MTSIESFPFSVIVDTKKETLQLFQVRNAQRLFLLPFCSQRKSQYVGWRSSGRWESLRVGRRLRAEASGSMRGRDGGKSSEDSSLDATIEKSKRMLDRQRELLQQIAERRKLVSFIKDSIIDGEEEVPKKSLEEDVLDRGSNGSTGDLNSASTSAKNAAGHQNASFSSPNYAPSNREEKKEISKAIDRIIDEGKKEDGESLFPNVAFSGAVDRVLDKTKMESKESSTSKMAFSYVVGKGPDEIGKEAEESLAPEKSPNSAGSSKWLEDVGPKVVGDIINLVPGAAGSNTGDVRHEDRKQLSSLDKNNEAENPAAEDAKPPPLAGANVMNIILVAAECAPWIKTGGLGDVAGSLPKALARRGHRVMVVVPRYGNYAEGQDMGIRRRYKVDGQDHEVSYFQAYIDGVDFVFIDSPMFRHIENNIYGGNRMDILKRMVLFCKAAVEVPWYVPCGGICYGDGNLVFIANDWHTALLPVYLKAYYRDNDLMKYTRSVLVIHNIAHQGRGPVEDFFYVDLPEHYIDLFKMYDPLGGDHFNIFAAGLKTADRIVTVSHGYSWELKTSEGGWGLHNIINECDWKFRGIVNGIDTKEWNPQLDVHLTTDGYTNYSLDTLHTGKPQCKAALQRELGLPVREDVPVIGFIGRLDHQKGVDLIAEAIPWIVDQDVQLVMLGTGRPDLEQMLRQFESQYKDKVRGWVGFSVRTAHRITAGADILLMPSRFEPCGLNQLYAMNYGTVPVVHAVGGLRDTVQQFDPFNESGLGWTFDSAESNKLINALGNCLLTYRQYKNSWEGLQRRGMTQDLSWDRAAENYEEVLVAAKYQW